MTYPNVYATQTGPLALSSLDANFLYAVDIANGALSATAGGTADAITATYSPAPAALVAGLTLYLRAASANATTTPQFSPNGLTGKVIVKNNNQALAVGDIAGAGHWLQLVYDATNGVWELMNPATFIGAVQTGGTANGVAYLNASKVLTTGTALTFDGTNFATTGTATATKLIPTGTSVTGNGLYLPAANALGLSTNSTNAVYIDASQNVGIGITSPAVKLHVSSSGSNFIRSATTGTTGQETGYQIIATNSDASSNQWKIATNISADNEITTYDLTNSQTVDKYIRGASGYRALWTNGSERMRIDSSGNVGIGTSSPSDKLTVISAGTQVGSTNFRNIARIGLATNDASVLLGYDFSAGSGIVASTNNYPLAFWTSSAGTYAEKMRIDSSGNAQFQTGAVMPYAPAPAAISAATTLTNANIQGQIISATGTTYTITMPLGSTLETLATWATTNIGYDFFVINTATGVITMAVNTGVTSLGSLTIAIGASAHFRLRRTAANTFVMYRLV